MNLIRMLGRIGHAKGCFNCPANLDFDEDGNIIVADMKNYRIQVLTPGGEHIALHWRTRFKIKRGCLFQLTCYAQGLDIMSLV